MAVCLEKFLEVARQVPNSPTESNVRRPPSLKTPGSKGCDLEPKPAGGDSLSDGFARTQIVNVARQHFNVLSRNGP
jgi:hypothetical protein